MLPRTIFLSRLTGLSCILVALSMITGRQTTLESVTAFLHYVDDLRRRHGSRWPPGWPWWLVHNIWSGGALVVVVTLVGWITLIKSLFFLFLPPEGKEGFFF